MASVPESSCSIARSLGVLGERWTFLILRDAFLGKTRFAEFRESLGVADSVLSKHVRVLHEAGYVDVHKSAGGSRVRTSLSLTRVGRAAYDGHVAALRAIVSNERLPVRAHAQRAPG